MEVQPKGEGEMMKSLRVKVRERPLREMVTVPPEGKEGETKRL